MSNILERNCEQFTSGSLPPSFGSTVPLTFAVRIVLSAMAWASKWFRKIAVVVLYVMLRAAWVYASLRTNLHTECVIEKQKRNPCLEYTNIRNGPSTNYGRIIRVVDLGSNFGRGKIFKRKKQKDRMNFHLLSWPIGHYLNTLVVLKITCLH